VCSTKRRPQAIHGHLALRPRALRLDRRVFVTSVLLFSMRFARAASTRPLRGGPRSRLGLRRRDPELAVPDVDRPASKSPDSDVRRKKLQNANSPFPVTPVRSRLLPRLPRILRWVSTTTNYRLPCARRFVEPNFSIGALFRAVCRYRGPRHANALPHVFLLRTGAERYRCSARARLHRVIWRTNFEWTIGEAWGQSRSVHFANAPHRRRGLDSVL